MGTVVGEWRLRAILVLFVTLFTIYTCYGLLQNISIETYDYTPRDEYLLTENDTTKGVESSQSFVDVVFGLGGFLTFDSINNDWARLTINIFVSCCWVIIGYIMYTFIKEWIPLT